MIVILTAEYPAHTRYSGDKTSLVDKNQVFTLHGYAPAHQQTAAIINGSLTILAVRFLIDVVYFVSVTTAGHAEG